MWDLNVSVPDHCLSFYFLFSNYLDNAGFKHESVMGIQSIFTCLTV